MGAGIFRSTPDTEKHTEIHQGKNLQFAVSHMCGWRTFMEDAHLAVSPLKDGNNSLFAIFDGHGGAEVAIFAQRHFIQQLQNNPNYQNQNYEAALRQTFFKIDVNMKTEEGKAEIKQIQREQSENGNGALPTESQAGCTANVWLITLEFIYVANAGDSRGVLSTNKKCQQTSKDHKPSEQPELERIQKAGGQVTMGRVNGNINLSRALGDFQFKKNTDLGPEEQMITANPEIRKFPNKNNDFAIIGCDGIWEEKSCQEMVKWVSEKIQKKGLGQILEELFDQLIAEERTGGACGTDNMSAILIKFKKESKGMSNDEMRILVKKYLTKKEPKTEEKSSKKVDKRSRCNDEMQKMVYLRYIQ